MHLDPNSESRPRSPWAGRREEQGQCKHLLLDVGSKRMEIGVTVLLKLEAGKPT